MGNRAAACVPGCNGLAKWNPGQWEQGRPTWINSELRRNLIQSWQSGSHCCQYSLFRLGQRRLQGRPGRQPVPAAAELLGDFVDIHLVPRAEADLDASRRLLREK